MNIPLSSAGLAMCISRQLCGGAQGPAPHVNVAGHIVVHVPQWAAFVASAVSHPLAGESSQSANPALQLLITHTPPAHDGVASGMLHDRPHAPQFATLVARSIQTPP